VTRCP